MGKVSREIRTVKRQLMLEEWEKQVTAVKNARKRYLEEKGLTLETIAPK